MLTIEPIPWNLPEHYFNQLADEAWAIFLHSAKTDPQRGCYSFIGVDPFKTWVGNISFAELKSDIAPYQTETQEGLPPFQTGIMGLWGYELLHTVESLHELPFETLPFPNALLGFYDLALAFDHQQEKAWILSSGLPETDLKNRERRASDRIQWLKKRLDHDRPRPAPYKLMSRTDIHSNFTRESYQTAVEQTIEAILNGDFFEANISQQFKVARPAQLDPWALYYYQTKIHQSPFSAYFSTPHGTLVSFSPERFLECRNSVAFTHPIKGTAPRDKDPIVDDQLAKALLASEKDRAENIMIVDLMRNDFSKVCLPHSVQVTKLCELESFKSVHHLVSTIQGTLAPDKTPTDLLAACFPGGSITGAPKVEVMKHIQKIEQTRRGPYCGSIGYLGLNQTLDTSIIIRSYIFTKDHIIFQTGGAITLDSDPNQEYEETLHKARLLISGLTEAV